MAKGKAKGDTNEGGSTGPKSGMEAVRWAMSELGYGAETQAVHDHILSKYEMELSNNKISAYKSNIRRAAGVSKPRGSRGGGRPASVGISAIQVEDIQMVKELVGRLGAQRVRDLIDVFHE